MPTFHEVVQQAISDISENGFDTEGRIAFWSEEIRKAAMASLMPEWQMQEQLRASLGAIYARLVDRGQVAQYHPGISPFTLEKIKPKLRAELDRRIMASASLIKLNREESVSATIRRLQGWATAIPPGGKRESDKAEAKASVKKALSQLPFIERRVIIDQGHKLTAAINEVVGNDGGALALIWRSHWRQLNYNFREDHKERDGHCYAIRGNWALKAGLMKAGPDGYYDEITAVGKEPFCLPGDARIPFADGVEIAYRRWYVGDMIELRTSSGKTIRATPNHPILTANGWIGIGSINEGDQVFEIADDAFSASALGGAEKHQHNAVPMISQIFRAFEKCGIAKVVSGKREQFHGDGANGKVDIVRAARPLRFDRIAVLAKGFGQFRFAMPYHCRSVARAAEFFLQGCLRASARFMRRFHEFCASFFAFSLHADQVCFGDVSSLNAAFTQDAVDWATRCAEPLRDREATFAGGVGGDDGFLVKGEHVVSRLDDFRADHEPHVSQAAKEGLDLKAENVGNVLDRLPFAAKLANVVEVKRASFAGHVFNLQTTSGVYVAEGIVTHNCRCFATYLYALRRLPDDMITEKGRAEMERARAAAGR